jgi:hypothetical protein
MKQTLLTAALVAVCGVAFAKLPAPVLDDAAKAKAAETAARNAWQAKVDAFQLCRAQDKVVAKMGKAPAKAASKPASPVAAAPAASAASGAAGTPVALAPPTPCSDPGPFAYAPPEQKPLEAAGAHSPAATATSPPSVKKPSAEMAPGGKKS